MHFITYPCNESAQAYILTIKTHRVSYPIDITHAMLIWNIHARLNPLSRTRLHWQKHACHASYDSLSCTIIYEFIIRYLCQNANEVAILGYVHLSYGSVLKSRVLPKWKLRQSFCNSNASASVYVFVQAGHTVIARTCCAAYPLFQARVCAHFPASYQTVSSWQHSPVVRSRSATGKLSLSLLGRFTYALISSSRVFLQAFSAPCRPVSVRLRYIAHVMRVCGSAVISDGSFSINRW